MFSYVKLSDATCKPVSSAFIHLFNFGVDKVTAPDLVCAGSNIVELGKNGKTV